MALFKTRNLMEKLIRPATDEERIGERNSNYLGYAMFAAIVGIFLFGCVKLVQAIFF